MQIRQRLLRAAVAAFITSSLVIAHNSNADTADFNEKNAALVEAFKDKPVPAVTLNGLYRADYARVDGSSEQGALYTYFMPQTQSMLFVAKLDAADAARWGKTPINLRMAGQYYYDGSVIMVDDPIGEPELHSDAGIPIEVISADHYRVHYYDRDGLRQSLDYVKVES